MTGLALPHRTIAEEHKKFLDKGGKLLISKAAEKQMLGVLIFVLQHFVLGSVPEPVKKIIMAAIRATGIPFNDGKVVEDALKMVKNAVKEFGVYDNVDKELKLFCDKYHLQGLYELWVTL